jgi:hypothetical protein
MTGQTIRGGTSFTQLLLDEETMIKYIGEAPADKRFDPETEGKHSDEDVDGILYGKDGGYCSSSNLHLDAPLPRVNEDVDAEEMHDANVVELVDE